MLRSQILWLFLIIVCVGDSRVHAQAPDGAATSGKKYPAFNIVPYDEDWSYLRNPASRSEWSDRLKHIALGEDARSYISIGGEFRGVFERVRNDNWSTAPSAQNTFGLERFLLHTDLHINPRVRTFLELQSGLEQGRADGPRPADEKRLDFLNAFVDVRPSRAERSSTLRIGKQELQLGSGRLISAREGPNVRQSFYGVRIDQSINGWRMTGIAVRPAVDRPGFFNGSPDGAQTLWGVVGSREWRRADILRVNASYYGLSRRSATFQRGVAQELRHTLSGNFVLDPRKDRPAELHLDLEGMEQFGSFGQQSIRAWAVASETSVTFPYVRFHPRFGMRVDAASGDRGGNGPLGSFNPLYPAGNYLGVFLDTGPGPVNFRDLHPGLDLALPHNVTLTPDWIFWWRQSLADGVYSVPGTLIAPAGSSTARYVGNRPGAELRWQMDRHAYTQVSYGVFRAGPFLRDSGRAASLNYLAARIGYKF